MGFLYEIYMESWRSRKESPGLALRAHRHRLRGVGVHLPVTIAEKSKTAHENGGLAADPFISRRQLTLTLAALGIVYGDIGTSPLYAVRESMLAVAGVGTHALRTMGVISLIFWSLIVVVTLKYVLFILRADNNGEGGVLALAQLAHRSPRLSRR